MNKTIIIGSRGSDLALWQAHFLQQELKDIGYASEIIIIKTQGDKIQHLSLDKLEGKGFFTKEIEDALLNKTIDVAVHSHKDLPTEFTPGLTIAAVSHREDASELIIINKSSADPLKLLQIKENAVVGTSSARRNTQLQFFRPDLQFKDIRGNVPTRIEKLRKGDFDAIVLAFAGVHRLRLNIDDLHVVKVKPQKIVPAPAQGVLAFQCREEDKNVCAILEKINDADVAKTISVERKLMQLFKGGCHMPLGVYCEERNENFNVWIAQADEKGSILKRMFKQTENVEGLAENLFTLLKKENTKMVFFSSKPLGNDHYLQVLNNAGCKVQSQSFVDIKRIKIDSEIQFLNYDWLFFSSKNGVLHFFEQITHLPEGIKIAAIGNETAKLIHAYGYKVDFIGEGENAFIADSFLTLAEGLSVLFPGALNRQPNLREIISKYCKTYTLNTYENHPYSAAKIDADVLVFTSALNVEGFLLENTISSQQTVIAMGLSTKAYLLERGYSKVLIPPQKSHLSIAELICGL